MKTYQEWSTGYKGEISGYDTAVTSADKQKEILEAAKLEAMLDYVRAQFAVAKHEKPNKPMILQWNDELLKYIEECKDRQVAQNKVLLEQAVEYIKANKPKRTRKK